MTIGLRAHILSGRHVRPEADALRSAHDRFLNQSHGALALWFDGEMLVRAGRDHDAIRALVDRDVALIDELIGEQLDALLHHPLLQRLEGSWRGLASLACAHEPNARVRIAVLSAGWAELDRDLARAIEFDQSHLFRLLYEDEFGRAGGEPFGLLVVDHELRHLPPARGLAQAPVDDLAVLGGLASIAAASFVPIVLGVSPALLGVDRFADLALSTDMTALLDDADHARWRALAAREDARFLALTAPRVLARPRWRSDPGGLAYEEHAATPAERTWSMAGYAFAAIVLRAHLVHHWPADIRGVPADRVGGGLVRDLAEEDFVLGAATAWPRAPADLAFTDRQERALAEAGIMPLNTLPHGDAAFSAVRSMQLRVASVPGRDPTPAQGNRAISAQISAVLCVSRFAHYIKMIGRELTGSFASASDVERRLQQWLNRYTNASPSPDAVARARHPLVSSRVAVREIAERPGTLGCVIHLQPFYQLDDVATVFRLVTAFAGDGSPRAGADTALTEGIMP